MDNIFRIVLVCCVFFVRIYNQCESHSTIREQGLQFVEVIKELLQRLLEYRAILNDENKENRMSCTVNLLVSVGAVVIQNGVLQSSIYTF